jgi:hypothetical protein
VKSWPKKVVAALGPLLMAIAVMSGCSSPIETITTALPFTTSPTPSTLTPPPTPSSPVATPVPTTVPGSESVDFAFVFQFGREPQAQHILDTFKHTYTQDSLSVDMLLSAAELEMVQRQMDAIDFYDYPDNFRLSPAAGGIIVGSPQIYRLTVKHNTTVKQLVWKDDVFVEDVKADNLRLLVNMIGDIIDTRTSQHVDSNFDLVFQYGVAAYVPGGGNILNTFKGTYTRDMVKDPAFTASMTLTDSEKDTIYQKMKDIGWFDYPTYFRPPGIGFLTPAPGYYFRVKYGSSYKQLFWQDNNLASSQQAVDLRDLIRVMTTIIESKQEYKDLPAPKWLYL